MNSYQTLLDRARQMIEDALRRQRLPAGRLDGQIDMSNMPAGTVTQNPEGGGSLNPGPHTHTSLDITDLQQSIYTILETMVQAGTNITLVRDAAALTIRMNAITGVVPANVVTDGGINVTFNGDYVTETP